MFSESVPEPLRVPKTAKQGLTMLMKSKTMSKTTALEHIDLTAEFNQEATDLDEEHI